MALSSNLLQGQASEWALLKRHESEDLFGVQLAGAYADSLTKTCQVLKENDFNVDFVDLNCGCPIDLIFKKGSGCGLFTRLDHLEQIIRSLDLLMDVPITAKIRTGVKDNVLIAHDVIPHLKTWGVSMITVCTHSVFHLIQLHSLKMLFLLLSYMGGRKNSDTVNLPTGNISMGARKLRIRYLYSVYISLVDCFWDPCL
jgi:hypothetical protein